MQRLVTDRTGLTGRFNFTSEWTTDVTVDAAGGRVSFITPLKEQLGLGLEPQRQQVEVLVIDSVERPTPN